MPEGRSLTEALVALMHANYPPALAGLPVALIRHLAGDGCADLLGLPPADWTRRLVRAGTALRAWLGGGARAARLLPLVPQATDRLLARPLRQYRQGKRAAFHI